jgi:hypothetical protein
MVLVLFSGSTAPPDPRSVDFVGHAACARGPIPSSCPGRIKVRSRTAPERAQAARPPQSSILNLGCRDPREAVDPTLTTCGILRLANSGADEAGQQVAARPTSRLHGHRYLGSQSGWPCWRTRSDERSPREGKSRARLLA